MRNFSAVIEREPDTGLFVGCVPGFPGAHSQGATLDQLKVNLQEVIAMLCRMVNRILNPNLLGCTTSRSRHRWGKFLSSNPLRTSRSCVPWGSLRYGSADRISSFATARDESLPSPSIQAAILRRPCTATTLPPPRAN